MSTLTTLLINYQGFQRAKPKGYVGIAMEDWQTELHSASAADLPGELHTHTYTYKLTYTLTHTHTYTHHSSI